MTDRLNTFAPYALAALRIVLGLLFLQTGMQKLFGFPPPLQDVPLDGLRYAAGVLELFGGALVLVGFLTRLTAFILSGMMAVAYFLVHAPQDFFPANNNGMAAILFCFTLFYIVFAGPGAWSIDHRRSLSTPSLSIGGGTKQFGAGRNKLRPTAG